MATFRCPACRTENEVPPNLSPFFCSSCREIIDPGGAISAPITRPRTVESNPGDTASYVSRYGTKMPRDAVGPGARFHVAGSAAVGYLLAAGGAAVAGAALAWLSAHVLRIPLLYPFLVGWVIKNSLAAGSGGGTPDRGLFGWVILLAILAGTAIGTRYIEYRAVADAQNAHFRAIFDSFPIDDTEAAIQTLKRKDPDGNGRFRIPGESDDVVVDDEILRLRALAAAKFAGVTPSEPFDIALIESVDRTGFTGYLMDVSQHGETLRFLVSRSAGWPLPGFVILILWLLELVVLGLESFSRIE